MLLVCNIIILNKSMFQKIVTSELLILLTSPWSRKKIIRRKVVMIIIFNCFLLLSNLFAISLYRVFAQDTKNYFWKIIFSWSTFVELALFMCLFLTGAAVLWLQKKLKFLVFCLCLIAYTLIFGFVKLKLATDKSLTGIFWIKFVSLDGLVYYPLTETNNVLIIKDEVTNVTKVISQVKAINYYYLTGVIILNLFFSCIIYYFLQKIFKKTNFYI